jgi:hypothetical protein
MSEDYPRRYTDLTALMYLLHQRKITLLPGVMGRQKRFVLPHAIQRKAKTEIGAGALSDVVGRALSSLERIRSRLRGRVH